MRSLSDSQRKALLYALLALLIVALWHQVFRATGVLYWDAPQSGDRVPAPAPLEVSPPDTTGVDLGAFLKTHPEWNPR